MRRVRNKTWFFGIHPRPKYILRACPASEWAPVPGPTPPWCGPGTRRPCAPLPTGCATTPPASTRSRSTPATTACPRPPPPALGGADAPGLRLPHQGLRHADAPRGPPRAAPPALRDGHAFELDRNGRILHPRPPCGTTPSPVREALEPLRAEGKLGLILMQFPPYFVANEANREYIVQSARRLAPDRMAVEFRHVSWVEPDELEDTLDLLASAGRVVCLRGRAPAGQGRTRCRPSPRRPPTLPTCASTAATPPPGTPA